MQKKNSISRLVIGGIGLSAIIVAMPAVQAQGARHSVKSSRKTKITAAQARSVTLRKYPGRVVGKPVLEKEEGKWQYAVMVQSGRTLREVMVGAYSGKIEDVEITTAAKEQVEKKAEEAAAKTAHYKPATKKHEKNEADEKNEKNEKE